MNEGQIANWGERLEAGVADDRLLELASQLKTRRLVAARPSAAFVEELRQRLLARPEARSRQAMAWLAPALLVAAIAVIVTLVLYRASPASAAAVLERANQHYADLAQEDGVLHTTFALTYIELDIIDQSEIRRHRWEGELWQDLVGEDFRYQLTDPQGDIHYFAQRSGEQFWRSAYPVLASRGDLVYRLSEDQYYARDDGSSKVVAPIFGSLIDWLELDNWWIARGAACENPFCAIGLEDNAFWTCEGESCTLPLASSLEKYPEAQAEVTQVGREDIRDGRSVEVLEIRVGPDDHLVRRLKFDSKTHELVEVIAYYMDIEMARMTFDRREILGREGGVWSAPLPEQLREVEWTIEDPPPVPRIAYAGFPGAPTGVPHVSWMLPIFALPVEGSTLEAGSELMVSLEVNAPLREDVELTAELCSAPPQMRPEPFDPSRICGGLASTTVTVKKGSGTARVAIPIEPEDTWPDRVWVYFKWVYSDGNSAGTMDPDYFWLIGH